MELKTSDIRRVIENDLGQKSLTKYPIRDFCLAAGIPRSTFYRKYANLDDLLQEYLSIVFNQIFYSPKYKTERTKYACYVQHLAEHQYLYENIYHLSLKRLFLNNVLTKLFSQYLASKYNKEGILSDFALMTLATPLTMIIIEWIDGGFKKTPDEVLLEIGHHITLAETIMELIN